MTLETYKILHLGGLILLFLGIGIATQRALLGTAASPIGRRFAALAHGLGLAVILVSGFGMLARLGIQWPLPGWAIAKAVIWLLLGALFAVAKRMHGGGTLTFWASFLLGTAAAWLAIMKPF